MQSNIESLATQMLALHQHLAAVKAESDRLLLERQIKATDQKSDQLVYELYNLADEEIRIIEEPHSSSRFSGSETPPAAAGCSALRDSAGFGHCANS